MLETLPAYFLEVYAHALMVAAAFGIGFGSARAAYREIKPPTKRQEPMVTVAALAFISLLFAYTWATVEEIIRAVIVLIPAILLAFWVGATWDREQERIDPTVPKT